jgi:hypothetical protein
MLTEAGRAIVKPTRARITAALNCMFVVLWVTYKGFVEVSGGWLARMG